MTVETLIKEYLTIEARSQAWAEEYNGWASDERKPALLDAMDKAERDMDLQIKVIANHTGNILSAVDAINEAAA